MEQKSPRNRIPESEETQPLTKKVITRVVYKDNPYLAEQLKSRSLTSKILNILLFFLGALLAGLGTTLYLTKKHHKTNFSLYDKYTKISNEDTKFFRNSLEIHHSDILELKSKIKELKLSYEELTSEYIGLGKKYGMLVRQTEVMELMVKKLSSPKIVIHNKLNSKVDKIENKTENEKNN